MDSVKLDLMVDRDGNAMIRAEYGGQVTMEPLQWLVEKALNALAESAEAAVKGASRKARI